MASAAAVPETRGTASRAVLDSPDLMSRCLEYVPDYYPEVAAVSRTFRATAAQKLQRALTFVREKGERTLGFAISESAKAAFDEANVNYHMSSSYGGEHAMENWVVKRELSEDAVAMFRFAWVAAPGETMSAVGRWGQVARYRFLIQVEDSYWNTLYFRNENGRWTSKDRHGRSSYARTVASFEGAYRFMAARVGSDDLLRFSKGLAEIYYDFHVKNGVMAGWTELLLDGLLDSILAQWSDPRLMVSFIFGPIADIAYFESDDELSNKYDCKRFIDYMCQKKPKHADAFRQAYEDMMTITEEYEASESWFPEHGLEYGRRVAVAQVWGAAPP